LQVALEQRPARDLFAAIKERLATLLSANSDSLIRILNRSRIYTAVDGSQVSLAGCTPSA
jgi:hypothetical protein